MNHYPKVLRAVRHKLYRNALIRKTLCAKWFSHQDEGKECRQIQNDFSTALSKSPLLLENVMISFYLEMCVCVSASKNSI